MLFNGLNFNLSVYFEIKLSLQCYRRKNMVRVQRKLPFLQKNLNFHHTDLSGHVT